MLVLSRQRGESIIIDLGDGRIIEVVVVDIRGDKVRLGTNAPKDIPVHRKEVFLTIQREQRQAAEPAGEDASVPPMPPPDQSGGSQSVSSAAA